MTKNKSKWKTTKKKMEDDQKNQVGRHKKIEMEDNLNKMKDDQNKLKTEDNQNKFKMEGGNKAK